MIELFAILYIAVALGVFSGNILFNHFLSWRANREIKKFLSAQGVAEIQFPEAPPAAATDQPKKSRKKAH